MTGWIGAAVLTLILCVVLFWLLRFGFPWTVSRDYKACFCSAPLRGRCEGPCKTLWLDFSLDLVVLRGNQDIKGRGDGWANEALCWRAHMEVGCVMFSNSISCTLHCRVTRLRRGNKAFTRHRWHTDRTFQKHRTCNWKRHHCGLLSVGWMPSCNTSTQSLEKNPLIPLN